MKEVTTNSQGNGDIISLFSTPIFSTEFLQSTQINDLIEFLRMQQNPSKVLNDHIQTQDDLHEKKELKEFCSKLLEVAKSICDFNHLVYDDLYITTMWATIATSETYFHPQHIHPNSLLSGILYLQGPKDCSGTMFYDPRPTVQVFEPDYTDANHFNISRYETNFKPGKMLIFPSWFPHGVMTSDTPYGEDDARITLSFNIMFTGKINKPTCKLSL